MARRSTLVAIAAIAAALLPAGAHAAPTGFSAAAAGGNTTPVTLAWTTTALDDATQQVYRIAGPCPGTLTGGDLVATPPAPILGGASATTDSPPDGTWCYYVTTTGVNPGTAGAPAVTVDRPSTGTVNVSGLTNGYIHGAVQVTGTSADDGSGVLSAIIHAAGDSGVCDVNATGIGPTGTTWTPGDGTYNVCMVVADNAGHTTTVQTIQVIADNVAPTGAIVGPLAGAAVTGTIALDSDVADDHGVATVQWRWALGATGGTPHTIGTGAADRNWNMAAGAVANRPPDGVIGIWIVVTDLAGNVAPLSARTLVTVDNTDPDAPALVTAPPAVAGSPTLSWTPAHDAGSGIDHYEVRRSGTQGTAGPVVGPAIASNGGAAYSYADTTAPDQATSYYTVRAFDRTGHFVDSAQDAVFVDSKAQSAAQGLGAATPTASSPVLNWSAPPVFTVDHYDVYRDGLLVGSTTGPAATYTDATAIEGVHDYAVLARSPSAQPGVLSSSFKVLLDKTPPTSGGSPTASVLASGSVTLAWPAAGDALSGVSGYVVRRAAGGTPPTATDGGTAVCSPTAPDCSDAATSTGTFSYGVFARDGAGNVALIGTVANVAIVDKTAPLAPTKLSLVKPKSKKPSTTITYTLRWVKPTAADLDRVVVVLNLKHAPTAVADGTTIYKGLASSTKVKLRAGQTGYLALFAYDRTGNVSLKPARTTIKLAGLIPLRPLNGSTVRIAAPQLTWKAAKGTSYYNVQLFIKGKRVLTGWPSKASFRIPKGKLQPGTYVWYVWPAIKGKGSSPTFGKLIGRATFTYKK
jgi:hypothetical protein